jgi:hypothetical protein
VNDQNTNNQLGVVVTAIDGDNLILETIQNKCRICWPLCSVPMPLEIGTELTLELRQSAASPVSNSKTKNTGDSDEARRKLLEALVN